MRTLYDILGVAPQASDQEIKQAFRQLARIFHTDIAGEAGSERFREVDEAYSVLRDPAKRDAYDAKIRTPTSVQELLLEHPIGDAVLAATLTHASAQVRRGNDLVRVVGRGDPTPSPEHLRWVMIASQGARGQNGGACGDLFIFNPSDATSKAPSRKGV